MKKSVNTHLDGYLYIAPVCIGILIFVVIPILASIGLSFTEWNMVTEPKFVGFKNYISIFEDPLSMKSFYNTIQYTLIYVPLLLITSILLALLVNSETFGVKFFRTVFFIPSVASIAAIGLVWIYLLHTDFGVVNYYLGFLGIPPVDWLTNKHTVIPALATVAVWQSMGYNMMLFVAGLKGIPATLYEAAKIDGARPVYQFFKITLPLLTPTVFFVMIMGVIGSIQSFANVAVMTKGGPANASNLYVYNLYQNAFMYNNRMGFACSLSVCLAIVMFIITLIQWKGQNKWVFYG
ncbi:MAG: carbohydrate ABC transporter permease [Massiliimalia sp.]|jgi:multiple sugar transport system permease protein